MPHTISVSPAATRARWLSAGLAGSAMALRVPETGRHGVAESAMRRMLPSGMSTITRKLARLNRAEKGVFARMRRGK